MNDELENGSLDLEDILKEFGEHPQEETPEEEPVAEDLEQTRRIDRSEIHKAQKQAADWAQETRRIDTVELRKKAADNTDDTIQFAGVRSQIAELIGEEQQEEQQEEAKVWNPGDTVRTEAFTERWEPEYEQPMGKYVPPQPIQFLPKNRLQELKKKLMEGPERRFYQLSEIGIGKLQGAIFLSVLLVLIAAASTVMYANGMISQQREKTMVFSQFMVLLFAGLLGSFQMIEGIADLGKLRFTPNTLLAVTFAVCVADGIFCLQQVRVPCSAAFSLAVTMSLWGTYERRNTEMSRMDTMRKAVRLDGVAACPDYLNGKKGLLPKEGQVEDFMDHYEKPGTPEKVVFIYSLVAMVLALGIGATAAILKYPAVGMKESVIDGLQVCAVSLLAAMPVTIFVCQSRPAWLLEQKLRRLGTVLCGWRGVEGLRGKAVFPVTGSNLYPPETLRMNGMKFFEGWDPEQVIAYATAMVTASNCAFAHLFVGLLDSHSGRHYEATEITNYSNGGMSGMVEGQMVQIGSWSFMKDMQIEVPDSARISHGMYVAIDGDISGVFALNYGKNPSTAAGLSTLTSYSSLECVMISDDFVVTHGFMKGRFGVKPKRFTLPDFETRAELRQAELPEDAPVLAMTTAKGFAPLAYGVTGARVLRSTSWIGAILHIIGGLLGLGIMVTLVVLGALDLITPVNMFLYQLIWMIPAILVTEWTRIV